MVTLQRKDLKAYLITHHKNLDLGVIDEFQVRMNADTTMNLVRIDINGIRGIVTNSVELAQEQYKHWSCEWVFISDHRVKMKK